MASHERESGDAIEATLDEALPRVYTSEVFRAKAAAIFQHIHERYSVAA